MPPPPPPAPSRSLSDLVFKPSLIIRLSVVVPAAFRGGTIMYMAPEIARLHSSSNEGMIGGAGPPSSVNSSPARPKSSAGLRSPPASPVLTSEKGALLTAGVDWWAAGCVLFEMVAG